MIGKNMVILNEETVHQLFKTFLSSHLFKDGDFDVTNIDKKSYETDWTITIEGSKPKEVDND